MPFSKTSTPSSLSCNICYLIGFIGLISCLPQVSAFGSGNIPAAAYLKGKAWRHGDIEDTLEGLVKVAGQGGSAIVGAIASALLGSASGNIGHGLKGGKKFTGLDVKRIYFGNWLRDLSQVCDIAGFKAMTPESLVICIMTMGFLTFGYATREFQVTRERLSVYLLTEHIDNPKGYAEGENPQKYDPRLRPPVDEARELRIDERNGMKMYIASEDQGFDTSTACIRRVFRKCIDLGRQAQREGNEEKEFESLRLLGTGLHTLEDFSAHSNWCELALQKLGRKEVFAHVGENVKVNSPEGPVPPLVTGTFAGADFCFSMLGEASDKLSSASIADLTAQLDTAQSENQKPGGINLEFIKSIMSKLPLGGNQSEVQHDLDSMDEKKQGFDLDGRIDQIAPEELQTKIWELFKIRDNLMRRIEEIIQGIPGLGEMLENLSLSLAQWVMVTIDPFVRPILLQASAAIGKSGEAVISGNDQWTVFNDPNASDPTHSVLAKDHFSNILNDPAGNISVIIVKYTVGLMVEAWSNDENPDRVIDRILEAIHHPNYANRNSKIQTEMLQYMQKWLNDMDRDERELTIQSLTKDSIRNHRNQRKTSKSGVDPRISGGTPSHGHSHPAYQQDSMLGGSHSQSQHGHTSQSHNQYGGAPPKSGSQSQSQYGGYQAQQTGSQFGTQNQYDNNRKTSTQSGYAGTNSSSSGRLNQPSLDYDDRKNSGGYSQGGNVSASHKQTSDSYGSKTGGAYGSVAERPDPYSSTHGHQSGQTSHAQSYGSSPGRNQYSHDSGRETSGYQSVADRREAYNSNYESEKVSSSQSYKHSGQTTLDSSARRNDYEQSNNRDNYNDNYNQSRPSFPQAHAEPVESAYGGRVGLNTSDRPSSGYSSQHGEGRGSHQHSSTPTFPEANYSSSQSTYGRSNASTVDAYRTGDDSGRDDYKKNPEFPQAHHSSGGLSSHQHNNRRDNESALGNRYADSGSTRNTNYSDKYGDSVRDQGYGQQRESRLDNDSTYGNRYGDTGSTRNANYSEKYGDSSREQGYGQDSEHRTSHNQSHNSHNREGKHHKKSDDSDDSDDSHGSKKHRHKQDKHKKNKSPDSRQGSHSGYQNQDNYSSERTSQMDSDYGMNRLNMQDNYSRGY